MISLDKENNINIKKHETWSDIAEKPELRILTPIQLSSERLEKKKKSNDIKNKEIKEA